MRPAEVLSGNLALQRSGCYFPYAYLSAEVRGHETTQYLTLMDTGASRIIVVMDAAEELLDLGREDIAKYRIDEQNFGGFGGGCMQGYGWRVNLRLKANPSDANPMLIANAMMYAVECRNILGYSVIFGQMTGFEQRWFKQHSHNA